MLVSYIKGNNAVFFKDDIAREIVHNVRNIQEENLAWEDWEVLIVLQWSKRDVYFFLSVFRCALSTGSNASD